MLAPPFASLATLTLVVGEGGLARPPVLGAALGALVCSPRRPLLLCLVGGLAGYAFGTPVASMPADGPPC